MLEKRQATIALARSWDGPQGVRERPADLPERSIVDLVRWAYRDELPKRPRLPAGPALPSGAWDAVSRWAEELSLAGLDDNRHGVVPDLLSETGPHDDALAIHDAVVALDACALALPADWSPLADWPQALAESAPARAMLARVIDGVTVASNERPRVVVEDGPNLTRARHVRAQGRGDLRLRFAPSRIVFRAAILGAPDWYAPPPAIEPLRDAAGRPAWFRHREVPFDGPDGTVYEQIEVDGWDERRKLPHEGAYQRFALAPDPSAAIEDRAMHEIWHACLCDLAQTLAGVLTSARPIAPTFSARPWEEAQTREPVILPDLTQRAMRQIRTSNENNKFRRIRRRA